MIDDLSKRRERIYNITATEMATLFGLNQYESPKTLIDKKNNPVSINNMHIRRGKLKEPSVLEAFYLDMGLKTSRHFEGTKQLSDHRIAATPDAYVKNTVNVVECKSVTTRNIEKWYDAVPTHYHMQVLVQMLVMESDHGYIGALEEGDPYDCEYRFIAWKIERNTRIEQLMKEEVDRFWRQTDAGVLYRVNTKVKKEVMDLLPYTSTMVYPTELPKKEERSDDEKLSDVLSLFQ